MKFIIVYIVFLTLLPLHLSLARLLIKSAILMPGAKEGEVTVVQIESQGYNKQKVGDEIFLLFVFLLCLKVS